MTKAQVMKCARENGVAFIKLWFTDLLGFAKSFTITADELENALEEGMGFDGSSIMPKPIFGVNGSGMHVHQSLFKGKKNAFFNEKERHFLSDVAEWYIAGLLRHARGSPS